MSADTATRSEQGFLGAHLTVSEREADGLAVLVLQQLRAVTALSDSVRTPRNALFTVVVTRDGFPEYRRDLTNQGTVTALLNGVKKEVARDRVPLRGEVKQNLLAALEYNVQWMSPGQR
ncbi:hypothetical protein [Hymenobacter glaciei]|uniref:hypothetical protein n=1 Tax=Hymenobacter glaciei TaxID=877209 RepID=UPI0031E7F372